jgi:hypothetical protein
MPTAFDVAEGDVRVCGAVVDVDVATGRATAIRRLSLDERAMAELCPAGPPPAGEP